MSINKIQYLTPFLKIYKKIKVVIIKNLYFQLRIFSGNIGYIKNIALRNIEWIWKHITMHPPINILINFNDFIKKTLQFTKHNIWKPPYKCHNNSTISKNFQYHHQILKSNTFKTFTINRYQLPLAQVFCFTNCKAQGQIFDHFIIDLCQPPNNMPLNMHNIYFTLSSLHFINGLVILWNITIQNISKAKILKISLEIITPTIIT